MQTTATLLLQVPCPGQRALLASQALPLQTFFRQIYSLKQMKPVSRECSVLFLSKSHCQCRRKLNFVQRSYPHRPSCILMLGSLTQSRTARKKTVGEATKGLNMNVIQDTIFLMFLCSCCRTRNKHFKRNFLFRNYDTDQE